MHIEQRGHVVTQWLIIAAMFLCSLGILGATIAARNDRDARTIAAKRFVTRTMSLATLEQSVTDLEHQQASRKPDDYETHFRLMHEIAELRDLAQLYREASTDALAVGPFQLRIANLYIRQSNALDSNASTSYARMQMVQSESFQLASSVRYQKRDLASEVAAATEESSVPYPLLTSWAMLFGSLFPLSLALAGVTISKRYGVTMLQAGKACFSDFRPLVASLTGPFAPLTLSLLRIERHELASNCRYLAYLTLMLLSGYIGGGVVKAQTPTPSPTGKTTNGKTLKKSFAERIELENGTWSSTSIAAVSDTDSGAFAETMVVKSAKTFSVYAYAGRKVAEWKSSKLGISLGFSGFGGVRFAAPRNRSSYLSAVLGARSWLRKGKFSLNVPFASFEQCLTKACRNSSVFLTRASVNLNSRLSAGVEQFSRFTAGSKASSVTYFLGTVKVNKRYSFSGGPAVNNQTRAPGFRFQLDASF